MSMPWQESVYLLPANKYRSLYVSELRQANNQATGGSDRGGVWESYAKSKSLLTFGVSPAPSDKNNPPSLKDTTSSIAKRGIDKNHHSDPLKKSVRFNIPLSALEANTKPFGTSSPNRYGFNKIIDKTRKLPVRSPSERALEDLYFDHPQVALKGIDHATLDLVATTIIQVTNEATKEWLDRWCPNIPWAELVHHIKLEKSVYSKSREENPFMVPREALDLKGLTVPLVDLFLQCLNTRPKESAIQLSDLVRLINQCTLLCDVLRDQKRRVLLEKVKETIQWIPVGLDCKKLDVQKQASLELAKINEKFGKDKQTSRQGEPLNAEDAMRPRQRWEAEAELLDRATNRFEHHRVAFQRQMLQGLQVLLEATYTE